MNNKCDSIDGFKIIGSTLWSHVSPENEENISRGINDYHLINKMDKPITIKDTNQWNEECVKYIDDEVKAADEPCIVLTHHAPLFNNPETGALLAHPRYTYSKYNEAFHNDLWRILKKPVVAWIYGHTHYVSNFKQDGIIVATNQLGYSYEHTGFNPHGYINLDKLMLDSL